MLFAYILIIIESDEEVHTDRIASSTSRFSPSSSPENIPWMPHSCYMGEEQCRPVAASCIDYMHRRQCCCDKLLVEFCKFKFVFLNIKKILI